ncbi:MAG: hypothetical protein KBB37_06265 [Bacteroidia bacterium]|nr:hypothetical protein [Bacteroidia bacterium]MBP9180708.1 hypothetical protein [Bacteroidia bacterium]MBP9723410.1 hypothetical protein [Bacteroidia bacterium]
MEKLFLSILFATRELLQKRHFLILSLFVLAGTTACQKEPPPPPSSGNCEQTGFIEAVPCGDGAWGNLYIRTSNGYLLKPCRNLVQNFVPADGMKIRFSATDPNSSDPCITTPDTKYNCFQPAHHDMVKVITCIKAVEETPSNKCNTLATVKQVALDGCKWIFLLDNGVKLEPLGVPSTFVLQDGMRVRIAYDDKIKVASICMMGKPAKILCIEQVRLCGNDPNTCNPLNIGKNPKGINTRFTIQSAEVDANGCLSIGIGFSGCSANGRDFQLYWDGKQTPGNATDFVDLVLVDMAKEEICEAYFTTARSFNINKLKELNTGGNRLVARIAGYNEVIEIK